MGLFALFAVSLVRYSPSHRVDRVLGFFSSRPNWDSPTPSPWPSGCFSTPQPPLVPRGGPHSLAGEGGVGSQFGRGERHCGTLGVYVLCGPILPTKEVIKEQPTPRNLSATATRVLLCTYMPCCSFSEIFFSYSHLTSPQLTSHLI